MQIPFHIETIRDGEQLEDAPLFAFLRSIDHQQRCNQVQEPRLLCEQRSPFLLIELLLAVSEQLAEPEKGFDGVSDALL
jgi:hypothetical protein